MPKKTLLVDCDTGIDDAIALLYLLMDPEVELCGVTTVFGNITAAAAAHNSLWVLDVAGRSGTVPVAKGSEVTLSGAEPRRSTAVHGGNGLGGAEVGVPSAGLEPLNAAQMIVGTVQQRPGQVHLLATGPLTNLALALQLEPSLASMVEGVTIMGGAAHAPGNITPAAEWNIWCDPEAARVVLGASWKTTLVPLDVTMRELMTEGQRLSLAVSGSPVARFAATVLEHYVEYYAPVLGRRACPCHDVLAAGIAVGDVKPLRSMTVDVAVDTCNGPGRGATICDTRGQYRGETAQPGAGCKVVLGTAGDFARWVVRRLSGGKNG